MRRITRSYAQSRVFQNIRSRYNHYRRKGCVEFFSLSGGKPAENWACCFILMLSNRGGGGGVDNTDTGAKIVFSNHHVVLSCLDIKHLGAYFFELQ